MMSVIPVLHSNVYADHVIYLDFDGYEPEETVSRPITCEQKGGIAERTNDPTTVKEVITDPNRIFEIWARVADDFAPFDVNVTTVEPDSLKSWGDPTGRAMRIAVGEVSSNSSGGHADRGWFEVLPDGSCGPWKIAYTNSAIPNVVFVDFRGTTSVSSTAQIANTASHEAGHFYGLSHYEKPGLQNFVSPIMERQSNSSVPQTLWHQGWDVYGQWQDDLAELTALLGARTYANGAHDDHGDTVASARQLAQTSNKANNGGNRLVGRGIIETLEDRDAFSFRVNGEGTLTIRLLVGLGVDAADDPPVSGPGANLNSRFELWDSRTGSLLGVFDTGRLDSIHTFQVVPKNIIQLPGSDPVLYVDQEYFVVVRGSGEYGDLGNYSVVVEGGVAGAFTPPDVIPSDPSDYYQRVGETLLAAEDSFPTGPIMWPDDNRDDERREMPQYEQPPSSSVLKDQPKSGSPMSFTGRDNQRDPTPYVDSPISQSMPTLTKAVSTALLVPRNVDAVFSAY